jgi:quercetin dioxygenase-like cupin family protein
MTYRPSPRPAFAGPALIGALPGAEPARRTLFEPPITWRRSLNVLEGLYYSTEHLTAGVLELNAGESSHVHTHGGDELVYALEGVLHVRAFGDDGTSVFELQADDAAYIPHGVAHEYRSYGAARVRALFGVAPSYLP